MNNWIKSATNLGAIHGQEISGTEFTDVSDLSLSFDVSVKTSVYVSAVLAVSPEKPHEEEKLLAKIELAPSGSSTEPVASGPFGYRSGGRKAQHSFVVDTVFDVEPGAYTVKVVVAVSHSGSAQYRLGAQGNCRMTLIAVPAG